MTKSANKCWVTLIDLYAQRQLIDFLPTMDSYCVYLNFSYNYIFD